MMWYKDNYDRYSNDINTKYDSKHDWIVDLAEEKDNLQFMIHMKVNNFNIHKIIEWDAFEILRNAILRNRSKALKTLLHIGMKVDCQDDTTHSTPLILCARNNNLQSLPVLMEKNANWKITNYKGLLESEPPVVFICLLYKRL